MADQAAHGREGKPPHQIPAVSVTGLKPLTHLPAAGLGQRCRRQRQRKGAGARTEKIAVWRNTAPTLRSASSAGQSHPCHPVCCKTALSRQLGSPHFVAPRSLHPLPAHWGSQRALWGGQGQDKPQLSSFFLLAEPVVHSTTQRSRAKPTALVAVTFQRTIASPPARGSQRWPGLAAHDE